MSRLQDKLLENRQRRAWTAFIADAPSALASVLRDASIAIGRRGYPPEWPSGVTDLLLGPIPQGRDAAGWNVRGATGVWHLDTDSWDVVRRELARVPLPPGPGWLYLGSELPPARIDCSVWPGIAVHVLDAVEDDGSLALASTDHRHGFAVSCSVDRLPPARMTNDRELVYDLVAWGPETSVG